MPYLNIETGQFGLTEHYVRNVLKDKSLPQDLSAADLFDDGFAFYQESEQPIPSNLEHVVELSPIDGVQQWALEPNGLTQADLKKASVPAEVYNYQAQYVMRRTKLADLDLGPAMIELDPQMCLWDAVLAAINLSPDEDAKLLANAQLTNAPGFRRDSELINNLGPLLGLTEDIIDDLFIAAKAVL